ncbi:LOB domain-containing protein 42-like [Dorcoceras hygrometricum]|uniref:LOB domain-containing protein 42-like n=1 Tax=Dorcoceras hygrometricum TaxID=472368 RepID=A0A2Z7A6A4_9LAMI|nr:LOB domain-containing protein 42-like [Dorcoceras hygrometricum]
MSCNGCRVLRKGCAEDCILRPSLQWISSSQSQANATLFLAKFYGRAGLINLIDAGPAHLRPVIFGSLLYEACGRIIDPVRGSVGLMSSGSWPQCQAAVEAVLKGEPIMTQRSGDDDSSSASVKQSIMPLQGCDIRHLSKDASSAFPLRVKNRRRFKRSAKKNVDSAASEFISESDAKFTITGWESGEDHKDFPCEVKREGSHDSSSVETVEQDLVNRVEPGPEYKPVLLDSGIKIQLELTLGFNPVLDTQR